MHTDKAAVDLSLAVDSSKIAELIDHQVDIRTQHDTVKLAIKLVYGNSWLLAYQSWI
jgi:hypothetical protein